MPQEYVQKTSSANAVVRFLTKTSLYIIWVECEIINDEKLIRSEQSEHDYHINVFFI